MKKPIFTNIFFENLSYASSYLKYFKVISLEILTLNLPKDKKEFNIKLHNKLVKDKKKNAVFVDIPRKSFFDPKKGNYHNTFYFNTLEKKHLSFLDNVYNKKLFNKENFSVYESVKHKGYNARFNKVFSFESAKLSETKVKTLKFFSRPRT